MDKIQTNNLLFSEKIQIKIAAKVQQKLHICKREGDFLGFFWKIRKIRSAKAIQDVGIQSRRNGQSIRRSDVRRTRQREAGIRCRGKEERGERKESRSRNSRAQDAGGDSSATEMPGTGPARRRSRCPCCEPLDGDPHRTYLR